MPFQSGIVPVKLRARVRFGRVCQRWTESIAKRSAWIAISSFFFFFLVTLVRETVEDRFACRGVRRPRNIVVSQRINPKTRTTLGYRAAFSRRSFTSKLKDDLQVWSVIWGREEEVRVEEDSCSGTVNGRCLEALRMMPMAKEIWRIILEKLIVQ